MLFYAFTAGSTGFMIICDYKMALLYYDTAEITEYEEHLEKRDIAFREEYGFDEGEDVS